MNVRECYEITGGNYEDVKRRFLSDARIRKFALMFLQDDSMDVLRAAIREKDCEKAFQAAHTMKGVCLNLGFSGLYVPVSEITEQLRAGMLAQAEQTMLLVEQTYENVYESLRELERS